MLGIYGLVCNGQCDAVDCFGRAEIRYVGQAVDIFTRFRKHKEAARANSRQSRRKIKWMREHGVDNIEVTVLEEATDRWALTGLEYEWIAALRGHHRLTNKTLGGGAPATWWVCLTAEEQAAWRISVSEQQLQRWANTDEEYRAAHGRRVAYGLDNRTAEEKSEHYSRISASLLRFFAECETAEAKTMRQQRASDIFTAWWKSLSSAERVEHIEKTSAPLRTTEARERARLRTTEIMSEQEARDAIAAVVTELWSDPAYARRVNEAQLLAWQNPVLKAQRAASQVEIMKRPEARAAAGRGGVSSTCLRWHKRRGIFKRDCSSCLVDQCTDPACPDIMNLHHRYTHSQETT